MGYHPSKEAIRKRSTWVGGFIGDVIKNKKKKMRWCKNHPTSYWGQHPDGEYYQRCVEGNRKNEKCEPGN